MNEVNYLDLVFFQEKLIIDFEEFGFYFMCVPSFCDTTMTN